MGCKFNTFFQGTVLEATEVNNSKISIVHYSEWSKSSKNHLQMEPTSFCGDWCWLIARNLGAVVIRLGMMLVEILRHQSLFYMFTSGSCYHCYVP
jgi:hypothetical protein